MPQGRQNEQKNPHVVLVAGEDEFLVKRRAQHIYQQWCTTASSIDNEIIDADARSPSEVSKVLARLWESLQTPPLFGKCKVVWLRNCSFPAAESRNRTAPTNSRTYVNLVELVQYLKSIPSYNTRLLISGGPVGSDSPLVSVVAEIGSVEIYNGLSPADRDWPDRAEDFVRNELQTHNQEIEDEALAALVAAVGPNLRHLANEIEKVSLHAGTRKTITLADVTAVVSRRKHAQAFGLAEAIGDRNLPAALRHLDEELAEAGSQSDRPAIGLVHAMAGKIRNILVMKELLCAGLLPHTTNYQKFKLALHQVPPDLFPSDPKLNPIKSHPYTLFKALQQTKNYTTPELVQGIEALLEANHKLVRSQLDDKVVLVNAVVKIIGPVHPTRTKTELE